MRKILNLIRYIRIIRKHRVQLKKEFGIKINWIYEPYCVISLPPERHKNAVEYGINGYPYLQEEVERFSKRLDRYLMSIGLFELIGVKDMSKYDDINVRVEMTYAHLNISKFVRNTIIFLILAIVGIIYFV